MAESGNLPECAQVLVELWECAGAIETCEEFEWFDLAAFGMAGLGTAPCAQELEQQLTQCN